MNFHKIVFVIAFLGIVAGGFFVNAQPAQAATVEELMALIAQLKAQILQLQQQLAQSQGQPAAWCHDFNTNIRLGDSGDEVYALQVALLKEGPLSDRNFLKEDEMSDETFGEQTASAVVGFQQKYASEILRPFGLKFGTGFVGKGTRAQLNALYGCAAAQIPSPPPVPTPIPIPLIPPLTYTPQPVSPSITVLSPNGGEQWAVGITQNISWKATADVMRVVIDVLDQNGKAVYTGIPAVFKTGGYSYGWVIPSVLTPGNYKVKIFICPDSLSDLSCANIDLSSYGYDLSDNYFSIVSAATTTSIAPEMVYPVDGQALNYGYPNAYMFKVKPVAGANGYLFGFFQNGAMIYENWRDDRKLSPDGEFAIWPENPFYSKFQEGNLDVWIRASINNQWSEAKIITIKLISAATSTTTDLEIRNVTRGTDFHPYGFHITVCVNGPKSINDLKLGNQNLKNFPVAYVVYDQFGTKYQSNDANVGGSVEDTKNGQCFTYGTVIQQREAPYYDQTKKVMFIADPDNLISESNESNNSFTFVESATAKPFITVLSPNGVESFTIGQTYDITWKYSGPTDKLIQLELALPASDGPLIATSILATSQRYSWTIPLTTAPRTDYRITIREPAPSYTLLDSSDAYFSIVSATTANQPPTTPVITGSTSVNAGQSVSYSFVSTVKSLSSLDFFITWGDGTPGGEDCIAKSAIKEALDGTQTFICNATHTYAQNGIYTIEAMASGLNVANWSAKGALSVKVSATPSITVLSPNGGEQWTFGTPQTITWNSVGINNLVVYLWFPDGGTCKLGENVVATWGKYTLTLQNNEQCPNIPRNITAGQYKIGIWSTSLSVDVATPHDYSDNLFSIVSASASLKNIEDQTASIVDAVSRLLQSFEEFKKSNP